MFFFVLFNVVFLLLLKNKKTQNLYKLAYDAFLTGQILHFLDRASVL